MPGLPAGSFASLTRSPAPSADEQLAEEEAARFEVEMTARILRYGMDASAGRVDPNKLSGYHDFPEGRISAKAVLDKLVASGGLPAPTVVERLPRSAGGGCPDPDPLR